jgi:hypothetical protein
MKIYILYLSLIIKEGSEIVVLGFLFPIIKKAYNLSLYEESIFGMIYFLFWTIGSILSGGLGDR